MRNNKYEIKFNNKGLAMMIMKYENYNNIIVKFIESGYITKARCDQFDKGEIKDVYQKSLLGVGYIGEGEYQSRINKNKTPQYRIWGSMLERCYSEKSRSLHPTYKECVVIEEWHNFQTFAKWYDDNYYEINGKKMQLDKDIRVKGNKVYSPETCVFVPQNINSLFIKSNAKRGSLPLGVHLLKPTEKFAACCNNGIGRMKYIGSFDTPEEAFLIYKKYKENLIKEIADKYKNKIPEELYTAMYKYIVEITD